MRLLYKVKDITKEIILNYKFKNNENITKTIGTEGLITEKMLNESKNNLNIQFELVDSPDTIKVGIFKFEVVKEKEGLVLIKEVLLH